MRLWRTKGGSRRPFHFLSQGNGRHSGQTFGIPGALLEVVEEMLPQNRSLQRTWSRKRWSCRSACGGGLRVRDEVEGQEPNPLLCSMNFHRWATCLPRWILRTRVKFAWFIRKSFAATWQRSSLYSATFPLPIPHPGVWSCSGPGLSSKKFCLVVRRRLLHVFVMALNYVYLGRPATLEEIGRCPNKWHLDCYDRLRKFIVACGLNQEEFPLAP